MIEQFDVLCRVKKLREERELRALQAKQTELAQAVQEEGRQREIVENSTHTLPAREKVEFDKIVGKIVDIAGIDLAKDRVLELQVAHQKLEDALERRIQIKLRIEEELNVARLAYQMSQRILDKFNSMQADIQSEASSAQEAAEESEIEELFSKGQRLPQ